MPARRPRGPASSRSAPAAGRGRSQPSLAGAADDDACAGVHPCRARRTYSRSPSHTDGAGSRDASRREPPVERGSSATPVTGEERGGPGAGHVVDGLLRADGLAARCSEEGFAESELRRVESSATQQGVGARALPRGSVAAVESAVEAVHRRERGRRGRGAREPGHRQRSAGGCGPVAHLHVHFVAAPPTARVEHGRRRVRAGPGGPPVARREWPCAQRICPGAIAPAL